MNVILKRSTYFRLLPAIERLNKAFGAKTSEAYYTPSELIKLASGYKNFAVYQDHYPNPDDDEIVLWIDDDLILKGMSSYATIIALVVPAVLGFVATIAAIAKVAKNESNEFDKMVGERLPSYEVAPTEE